VSVGWHTRFNAFDRSCCVAGVRTWSTDPEGAGVQKGCSVLWLCIAVAQRRPQHTASKQHRAQGRAGCCMVQPALPTLLIEPYECNTSNFTGSRMGFTQQCDRLCVHFPWDRTHMRAGGTLISLIKWYRFSDTRVNVQRILLQYIPGEAVRTSPAVHPTVQGARHSRHTVPNVRRQESKQT
jgi:hypothetical protein